MPKLGAINEQPYPPRDMTQNTWGKVRSEAARLGYSQAQISEYLGDTLGGRKTEAIVDSVYEMMRSEDAAKVRKDRNPNAQEQEGNGSGQSRTAAEWEICEPAGDEQ